MVKERQSAANSTPERTTSFKYTRTVNGTHTESFFDSLIAAIGHMHKEFDLGFVEDTKVYDSDTFTIWTVFPLPFPEEGYRNSFLKTYPARNR